MTRSLSMKNVLQERLTAYKHQHKVLSDLIEKMESIIPFEEKCSMLLKGIDVEDNSISQSNDETISATIVKTRRKMKPVRARKIRQTSNKVELADKPMSLPSLVQKIVSESKEPLTYMEVADMALKNGYKSSAKNFANNVYQSLNIHVRNKTLRQQKVDGQLKFSV